MGDDIFNVRMTESNSIEDEEPKARTSESDNMFWTRLWKYYINLEMESPI